MPENHPVKLDYVRKIAEYTWEDIARPVTEPAEVVTDDSDYEDDKDDDSNWNAAIAAARQEGRRQGIASATMAHLRSFPRFPRHGVGSANSSTATSAATSVPSAAASVPIAGPSTFVPTQYPAAVPNANPYAAYAPGLPVTPLPSVTQAIPTQYPTAVPAVPAMPAIPNANPYAVYKRVFPATSVSTVAQTIPTPNLQSGQVPQPAQLSTSTGQTPLTRAASVDPRCEGLRTVLRLLALLIQNFQMTLQPYLRWLKA